MRSLFTQTCQQKQVFLVSLLLKKMREEVGAYSKGGGGGRGAIFRHYEIGGRHSFGEGHLLGRGRLVEEIRYSLFIPFFRADIILFKVSDELLYFSQ